MLSDEQKVRICDFGLSKIIDENEETFDQCQLGGTIEYCAPEQIQYEPVSDKSDIWSLGTCQKYGTFAGALAGKGTYSTSQLISLVSF